MLLVTLALKTLLSLSQNGFNQITLNKQIGNHLNRHIINASKYWVRVFVTANQFKVSLICAHCSMAEACPRRAPYGTPHWGKSPRAYTIKHYGFVKCVVSFFHLESAHLLNLIFAHLHPCLIFVIPQMLDWLGWKWLAVANTLAC
jgi:hypothetical protein